jgi:hypothetical protein
MGLVSQFCEESFRALPNAFVIVFRATARRRWEINSRTPYPHVKLRRTISRGEIVTDMPTLGAGRNCDPTAGAHGRKRTLVHRKRGSRCCPARKQDRAPKKRTYDENQHRLYDVGNACRAFDLCVQWRARRWTRYLMKNGIATHGLRDESTMSSKWMDE